MATPELRISAHGMERVRRELLGPLAESGARILKDEIRAVIVDAPPRTGHVYMIPGTKAGYVASAPGEPPAERTAVYRDSWSATPAVVTGSRVVAFAFSTLTTPNGHLLGALLEWGTVRMAPRPHIRLGIENARGKLMDLVRRYRSR